MQHLDVVRYVFDHGGPTSWHRNVMDLACATSLEHAKLFHEYGAYGCSTGAMDGAAANGHLETVRFQPEHRFEGCSTAAMDNAATHGYLEVIQFLHEHRVEGCTFRAMDNAAAGGHLDAVKFLHKNRDEGCSNQAMNAAAGNGHLQVVKFLHANRSEGCSGGALVGAAAGNHMDVVKFLVKNGLMDDDMPHDLENAASSAAGHGHLDILTYLLELWERPELPDYVFRSAVETGNLDIVKHVYHSMKWDPFQVKMNTEIAASRGHYDIVEYICKANGGFEDFGSFEEVSEASKYGHIEVVRQVLGISSRCFSFDALAVAAEHGHVELLKYLHRYVQRRRDLQWEDSDSESIDFDDPYKELEEGEEEEVIRRAIVRSAENGHLEVVQWIYRLHPSHFTHHALTGAAFGGHRDLVAFLLERTPLRPTNRAISLAVERGHLTLVHMLGERYSSIVRCRRSAMDEAPVKGLYNLVQSLHIGRLEGFTVKALDGAASNGRLDVVRFLHFYRGEGCTKDAMDGAAANGHFEIVRFLHEKRQEG